MHFIYNLRPTYLYTGALTYLFTYLHSWLGVGEYKTGNISETVEDRAKAILTAYIKSYTGFRLIDWLISIAAKMYDLEWPLSEIQGQWFFKCRKMTKYSLVMTPMPCRVAGSIISIRPTYSCVRALIYLLTYTTQNNQCFCRLACEPLSWLHRMICLPFHCLCWALK